MKEEPVMLERSADAKDLAEALTYHGSNPDTDVGSEAALGALLEEDGADAADAERRVRRLGERVAQLDALNVAGMLAAATGGAGARLAARLEAGLAAGAALGARLRRCEALARGAPDAVSARSGAERADSGARLLLQELADIYDWLDPPPLRDLDSISEVSLATAEGRASALQAASALRSALRGECSASPARRRLAAVRERLRRLGRAREQLAAALARHLNNALIHLGNEAQDARGRHHAELLPYAPFMRWLKDMDEKAFDALAKVYTSTWSRVYEREARGACEAARGQLAAAPERADPVLAGVLTFVENLCNAEQDFCQQFFFLDVDVKGESDSEHSDAGSRRGVCGAGAGVGGEGRRVMQELFPKLESELVALVAHIERSDPLGAMRALACVGRRVLGAGEGGAGAAGGAGGAGEARWARGALAAVAVGAKRGADRCVAERIAGLSDAVRQAAKRPKCGLFSFLAEFEEFSAEAEVIFAKSRRADLDRWYVSLAEAMMAAIHSAEHPRTPRAAVRLENYHRLQSILAARRVPALDEARAACRARYKEALRCYVTTNFGRPLEKLAAFFEGVAEAVAAGAREDEVAYRAAFSKHELRRVLALYPAAEVRKSLHRLYKSVEKQLSESGLLQVVWRALQEQFLAQHNMLEARLAACYPGAGLQLPLDTQDILDAFSDIAREH